MAGSLRCVLNKHGDINGLQYADHVVAYFVYVRAEVERRQQHQRVRSHLLVLLSALNGDLSAPVGYGQKCCRF
ncbi:hypothetical protein SDC9_192469 [bioreactor metagenome]|uniref:Uncharacterized protein n=1 Tax=bioreactor metagenome TaxID=1076179 RepID=A0A645I2C8_9ZZZZ